jgi:hypothetical protein
LVLAGVAVPELVFLQDRQGAVAVAAVQLLNMYQPLILRPALKL